MATRVPIGIMIAMIRVIEWSLRSDIADATNTSLLALRCR